MFTRIAAIGFVYLIATLGWVALGTTITYRTDNQDASLKSEVGQLWGTPLVQQSPAASLLVERVVENKTPAQSAQTSQSPQSTQHAQPTQSPQTKSAAQAPPVDKYDVPITENDIRVGLELDQRQKGLLWYSTYRVRFTANYTFENVQDKNGELIVHFSFPARDGLYDEFKFEIDGAHVPTTRKESNQLVAKLPSRAKQRHRLSINYYSNGIDSFMYRFGDGISEVRNFQLAVATNFEGVDFPGNTLSPTSKEKRDGGWQLTWGYKDLITGNGIGVEMPRKINPGPMAARISYFAPVSLGFFFFLIFIISLMKGIRLHPMNYFFLAASFFAFHLLLAYLVDHISIHLAFIICSLVSIFLVISYMRIVVGSRFAYIETGLSQFVYLIGFSYAFFIEGFTGLAVTIGSIVTLFVVMQMTARINWAEKFKALGSRKLQELQE
ncbi:MAG TPA: inner membrane CreD family protein [Blastocatellia bacterium]|nr:inner membrane CreD family protein [Blastocatellia bacterium]